ncbi:alpha-glucuronidase family glycosyl hydrolase [Petroclostridium xylanilyticum]|jgi:alpha-glucuronidase|uniref:alpha-glucuronidase family glycosyl hydrolase n=1 Tax=Petroclostridium xylanilyticum TaxID=1792311 RepID=UPI000B991F3F|nr:alpha-glucuronidase family glycosyl hydrolase [Petroclostridium xylanilyticum]
MSDLKNTEINETYSMYDCWLKYRVDLSLEFIEEYRKLCRYIVVYENQRLITSALNELKTAIRNIFGFEPEVYNKSIDAPHILIGTTEDIEEVGVELRIECKLGREGYIVQHIQKDNHQVLLIMGNDERGILYGIFHLIRSICIGKCIKDTEIIETPKNKFRIINHWDNISGDIERGYSGKSIFFENNRIIKDVSRIKDYARLLASVGINGVVINNVNVHKYETRFITDDYLPDIARIADVFREYGVQLFLSINFAAPIEIDGLPTADPLNEDVRKWWKKAVERVYKYIPDFGGFLVKADSEYRPGPYTYGRNHAEGANMLAEALKPFNGIVIWRCFVYDCQLDWRDRSKDRAKAAYENFKPLDGQFMDNVILQVKHGPMDFQIREPISPLFAAMEKTNQMMEFQITQEYTGQQKHLCYLVPMWKECLDFDIYAKGEGSYVSKIVDGTLFGREYGGIAAVSNIGDSKCWTGHPLAQANLYGFGRLAWNSELTSEEIAEEWIKLTFGSDKEVVDTIMSMLLESASAYEKYTVPLGIGWMVNPGHHYGPNVDGYEYSPWGTYHYADFRGIGVDRTVATGTGYTAQYKEPLYKMYESIETCPEELLLFFHHVPYTYELKSGKTVIQHIYDTHFEGVEQVKKMREKWASLQEKIDKETFELTLSKFDIQVKDAREWRDVVNTYFYRRTGIKDIHGRKIYE